MRPQRDGRPLRRRFGSSQTIGLIAVALLAGMSHAHEDPAGCFETPPPALILSAFRNDGVTGVVGTVSSCETILYRATLQKNEDIDTICAFSGGTFTLTTPDGVVHEISSNVPCIGGNTGLEGCDDTINSIQSALIPYTVSPADISGGFLTATSNYTGGTFHQSPDNVPGATAFSPKQTPVSVCIDDNNACTTDICDPSVYGSAACQHTPIACDDANACTFDVCDTQAGCTHTPVFCSDGDNCTTDSCDPATGCVHAAINCNDHNACTTESCNPATGACDVVDTSYPGCELCGNHTTDANVGEQCDLADNGDPTSCCDAHCHYAGASVVCRPAAGPCDAAETCPNDSEQCPVDARVGSGVGCPDDGNPCTVDACDGTQITCLHTAGNAGTTCREKAGDCDIAETCTGDSAVCPSDVLRLADDPCEDDGNVCTSDVCNGVSPACQHPPAPFPTECRAKNPNDPCDVAEICQGSSCPDDGHAPLHTPCTTDGVECTKDECNAAGACTHEPKERLTPCGENAVCNGTVCVQLPPNCTVIDPPVHDPGEECDDGPKNETISSCCTFACTFKTVGRPCDGVPNGICDGKGSCVTPGVCGNGIKEAASIIDGAATAEECDPKEAGLSDDTGQGTCCDTHCQLHPAGFKCKFAANTCEVDSECTGTGLGLCPPQHNESHNDQLCKRNDCFINSSCLDGQCVGGTTLVCDANVTVKKPKKFVPNTNVECVPTNGATASPDARCTVQVMRPLSEGLSSTGLSLLGLGGSALTSAPIKISKKCRDASAVVAAQCPPLVDGNVVWCVNQDLALNSLDACPLNECGKALHAFAEKCPKAIDKRASGTLRENVVAKITGLSFDGEPLDEQNREKQCVGKQCP